MMNLKNGNGERRPITLADIKALLPLVLILVAFVAQWATVQTKLSALEANQGAIEARQIKAMDENNRQFNVVYEQLGARVTRNEEAIKVLTQQLAAIGTKIDMMYDLMKREAAKS